MNTTLDPSTLIGTFKRFGEFGIAYEVIDVGRDPSAKEAMVHIHVLDTGEELDYLCVNTLRTSLRNCLVSFWFAN